MTGEALGPFFAFALICVAPADAEIEVGLHGKSHFEKEAECAVMRFPEGLINEATGHDYYGVPLNKAVVDKRFVEYRVKLITPESRSWIDNLLSFHRLSAFTVDHVVRNSLQCSTHIILGCDEYFGIWNKSPRRLPPSILVANVNSYIGPHSGRLINSRAIRTNPCALRGDDVLMGNYSCFFIRIGLSSGDLGLNFRGISLVDGSLGLIPNWFVDFRHFVYLAEYAYDSESQENDSC